MHWARVVFLVVFVHVAVTSPARAQSGWVPPPGGYGGFLPGPGYQYVPPSVPGNFLPPSGPSITPMPVPGAINNTLGSVTPGAINNTLNGGSPIKVPLGSGARVLFAGGLLLTAAGIYGGLNWFLGQAQDAAKPSAWDAWRNGATTYPVGGYRVSVSRTNEYANFMPIWNVSIRGTFHGYSIVTQRNFNQNEPPEARPFAGEGRANTLKAASDKNLPTSGYAWVATNNPSGTYGESYLHPQRPGAQDALKNDGDLQQAFVSDVLPGYIANGPKESDGLPPGVDWDGAAPNVNQFEDNPNADPNLDSDGDGWPDGVEAGLGHLPIDPYNPFEIPPPLNNPDYDYDDDGYSDGNEVDNNTDPNNPDEHPLGKPDRPMLPIQPGMPGYEDQFDPTIDKDQDGVPNNEDIDDDADGIPDESENPDEDQDENRPVPVPQQPGSDPDGDGQPNESDPDDDGDAIPDGTDPQPYVPYVPGEGEGEGEGEEPGGGTGEGEGEGEGEGTDTDPAPGEGPSPWNPYPDPTPGDGIEPTPGDGDGDGTPDTGDPDPTPYPDPTPGDGIEPTPGDGDGNGRPDLPTTPPDPNERPPTGGGTDGEDGQDGEDGEDGDPCKVNPQLCQPTTPGDIDIPDPDGELDLEQPAPWIAEEPELDESMSDELKAEFTDRITALSEDLRGKFPFGLGSWLPGFSVSGPGGGCQNIQMTILGTSQEVGLCGTPIHDVLANTGRAGVLALLMLGYGLATGRVISGS